MGSGNSAGRDESRPYKIFSNLKSINDAYPPHTDSILPINR